MSFGSFSCDFFSLEFLGVSPTRQGMLNGTWVPLEPPPDMAVLFAGDMLERLTNGQACARAARPWRGWRGKAVDAGVGPPGSTFRV